MKLVTVKTFDNSFLAHLVKTKLQDEGIMACIADEHTVTLNQLWNTAIGGIKIQIKQEDLAQAKALLKDIDEQPEYNTENQVICCPNCQSTDYYRNFVSMRSAKGIIAAVVSLFLFSFPFHYNTVCKCKSCETEFNKKSIK